MTGASLAGQALPCGRDVDAVDGNAFASMPGPCQNSNLSALNCKYIGQKGLKRVIGGAMNGRGCQAHQQCLCAHASDRCLLRSRNDVNVELDA